jgi:hypothetical protein
MREVVVIEAGALALLICGRCRNRSWLAAGEPIGPELALKIAQMFDQPGRFAH